MRCPNGHDGAFILFNIARCPETDCKYYDEKALEIIWEQHELEQEQQKFYQTILKGLGKFRRKK